MTSDQFLLSPGAGGAGALLAALVIGASAVWVSRHRRTEANKALEATNRHAALDRWWSQYTWLVSVDADLIPIEGRAALLQQVLAREACERYVGHTKIELVHLAAERNLPQTGTVEELVDRLAAADAES